ncbi:hypothetical protein FACS1894124_1800 [Spirochaetia bacterium]|nr:hypothetical protein FACS1894124_1800 [Spirochaetia bacterium]
MNGHYLPSNITRAWAIPLSLIAVLLPALAVQWNLGLSHPVPPAPMQNTNAVLSKAVPPEYREAPLSLPTEPHLAKPAFVAQLFHLPRQGRQAPDRLVPPSGDSLFQETTADRSDPDPETGAGTTSADIKPWEAAPENFTLLGRIRDTDGTEYVYFKNRESGEIIKTENRQD